MATNMKKELSEFICEDTTYKTVRDAFKKIGFGHFDIKDFVTGVLINDLKDYYTNKFNKHMASKHFILGEINHIFRNNEIKKIDPQLKSIIEKGVAIHGKAIEEELIEKSEYSNNYQVSKKGHSLRNQLAIKRIPLERAYEIINKLLDKVESLNRKDLPFRVDNLYIYGSVQRHESDAGDIDLALSYSKNMKNGETVSDWNKRVAEQYDVSSIQAYSLVNKLTKELKISPYISLSGEADLDHLMETDVAEASLLYQRDKTVEPKIKCEQYRMPIIEEESSFSM